MKSSEDVKALIDKMGSLGFMLETYVKLLQTGDHGKVRDMALYSAWSDCRALEKMIDKLLVDMNPQVSELADSLRVNENGHE